MSQGITVYRADGTVDLEIGNRLFHFHSRISYPRIYGDELPFTPHSMTFTVPGMTDDGSWFIMTNLTDALISVNQDQFTITSYYPAFWLELSFINIYRA